MENKVSLFQKLGGTKFVLAMLIIGLATWIELSTVRGITAEYAGLLLGILGVYGASNVAISRKAMSLSQGISEAPNTSVLEAKVESLSSDVATVSQGVANTNKLLAAAMTGSKNS